MNEEKIRDLMPAGWSQAAIAKTCNVSQQAVSQWLAKNEVPVRRVFLFHQATKIPKHILNKVFN
ncbi:helix-turn-helix domain-containing protein [Shewanella sp. 1180_01]|uniref:helix-turn-helix domain-containing protein n=1 Tax=Shewanella sp. 1180_01 TaxID=2604451 RepID=UPI0040648C85